MALIHNCLWIIVRKTLSSEYPIYFDRRTDGHREEMKGLPICCKCPSSGNWAWNIANEMNERVAVCSLLQFVRQFVRTSGHSIFPLLQKVRQMAFFKGRLLGGLRLEIGLVCPSAALKAQEMQLSRASLLWSKFQGHVVSSKLGKKSFESILPR